MALGFARGAVLAFGFNGPVESPRFALVVREARGARIAACAAARRASGTR